MKPLYPTVYVTLGGRAYTVDCRILPLRAEALAWFARLQKLRRQLRRHAPRHTRHRNIA